MAGELDYMTGELEFVTGRLCYTYVTGGLKNGRRLKFIKFMYMTREPKA